MKPQINVGQKLSENLTLGQFHIGEGMKQKIIFQNTVKLIVEITQLNTQVE